MWNSAARMDAKMENELRRDSLSKSTSFLDSFQIQYKNELLRKIEDLNFQELCTFAFRSKFIFLLLTGCLTIFLTKWTQIPDLLNSILHVFAFKDLVHYSPEWTPIHLASLEDFSVSNYHRPSPCIEEHTWARSDAQGVSYPLLVKQICRYCVSIYITTFRPPAGGVWFADPPLMCLPP